MRTPVADQPRHFASFTAARNQFRAVLDSAQRGLVTTVDRESERFVVLAAEQLREDLVSLRPANAAVTAEGGGWSVVLPGLPVHGDGAAFTDAIEDVVAALREYAADWNLRLHAAPNHRRHHAVVELVELSDDAQLRDWVVGRKAGSGHQSQRFDASYPFDGVDVSENSGTSTTADQHGAPQVALESDELVEA